MKNMAAAVMACLFTGVAAQMGVVSDIPDAVCADISDSEPSVPGFQPDGRVGVDDLLVVLGNFRRTGTNVADLNGDRVVDVEDLLGLLAQFHSECTSTLSGGDDPTDEFDTSTGATTDLSITVTNEFVDSIASQDAMDDCYISPEEMAENAAMGSMLAAFQEAQAAALGVRPDQIIIDGIHTDADDVAGCSHSIGQDIAVEMAATFIDTLTHDQGCGDTEYPGQHTCGGWADCTLNVPEMANDPEAIQLIKAVIEAQCLALGLPLRPDSPDADTVYCEDVVEVDAVTLQDCTPDECVVPDGAPDDFCAGRRRAQIRDQVVVHVETANFGIVKAHVAQ